MSCASYVINRVPLSPINMKSPYELLWGKKPNVKHFKIFGSICYVHVPYTLRTKLDAKAKKCIFVGYDERKKGWKCMDPTTNKFIDSIDVFDEVTYYKKDGDISQSEIVELLITHFESSDLVVSDCPSSPSTEEKENGGVESSQRSALRRSSRTIVKLMRYRDGAFVSIHSCFVAGPF